jgi:hypothetical protein
MITVPPVAPTVIAEAPGVAPTALAICTGDDELPVVEEIVNVAVAITPAAMAVVFNPLIRQIVEPPLPLQTMDLPAAEEAAPTTTVSPAKSVLE